MAKKEETPNMVEQFAEFKELKNIDKTTMISVLEESFRNVLAKMLYRHRDHEGHIGIALARLDRLEHAVELAAVGSEHLNIVAHVLLVLAAHDR